jgi:hypothetical protein
MVSNEPTSLPSQQASCTQVKTENPYQRPKQCWCTKNEHKASRRNQEWVDWKKFQPLYKISLYFHSNLVREVLECVSGLQSTVWLSTDRRKGKSRSRPSLEIAARISVLCVFVGVQFLNKGAYFWGQGRGRHRWVSFISEKNDLKDGCSSQVVSVEPEAQCHEETVEVIKL